MSEAEWIENRIRELTDRLIARSQEPEAVEIRRLLEFKEEQDRWT